MKEITERWNYTNMMNRKKITGKKIIGFQTSDLEGFDINYPEDLLTAKKYLKN